MCMLIYSKATDMIIAKTSRDQSLETYLKNFDEGAIDNFDGIYMNRSEVPQDYKNYKVINGQVERLKDLEISEIQMFGRVLTSDQRIMDKLRPSYEEVQKAENTIEILSLLMEVM